MNYLEKYQAYSDEQIIRILHEKEKYTAEALAAAQEVLASRNTAEPFDVPPPTDFEESVEDSAVNQSTNILNALPSLLYSFFQKLRQPKEKFTAEELVKMVALVLFIFAVYALYGVYLEFEHATQMGYKQIGSREVQIWAGSVLIPFLAGLTLWYRKTFAWIIAILYLLNQAITELPFLLFSWKNSAHMDNFKLFWDSMGWVLLCVLAYALYQRKVLAFLSIERLMLIVVTVAISLYSIWQCIQVYGILWNPSF